MPATPRERRRSPRHRAQGPVEFRIENWHLRRGRILNLCLQGCLIEPQHATDCIPGDTLDLRFEIHRLAFRARAIVRSHHPGGRLGVEITELSPRSHVRLQQLIAELAEAKQNNPG
ncbi:MAG: PilZ domain-containing protein [Edaphobacter sp.]|uniref:PilZ domain-containing protein n=1 Tax=Edaphobacter sp. TaxID=1934404 RepID=UPI00239B1BAB|nr:PilZ domain-containing protein [Edaphobacter sp.]MDE1175870.1 PilZ domain-containing protein [Edaphobacter sp.]